MKENDKDCISSIVEELEKANTQAIVWGSKEKALREKIKTLLNKRYSSMVARKLNALCEKYFVSGERHWTLINHSISDGLNWSTTPPKLNPCVFVEFLLYIHEDNEVCRDEIHTNFNIAEMDVALARIERMMEAGVKKGSK